MRIHFRLFIVFLLLISISGFAGFSVAQVTQIDAAKGASVWTIHSTSGRIFAADTATAKVIEYDGRSGQQVRAFDVSPAPEHLIIKNEILCVGCTQSPRIVFINLKSNDVVGELEIKGKGPYGFFCSQVANPYIYCFSKQDGSSRGVLMQIDIQKKSIRKQQTTERWPARPVNVAMSADGKWIVPDARGESSPSGADLMEVDEESFEFVQLADYHKSFGQIVASPFSRFWTLGDKLYSLDIQKEVRSYAGTPLAIHPTYDLVAGFNESSVIFQQFSDTKKLATVSFPKVESTEAESKKKSRRSSSSRKRENLKTNVCLQFDFKNETVVAAKRDKAYIVSLRKSNLSLVEKVLIDAPSKISTVSGKVVKFPIRLTNPKLAGESKFELKSPPTGATIKNNHVVWTPTEDQIGDFELVLQATSKGRSDTHRIAVNVSSPSIELDFDVTGLDVEDSGRYALVWGRKLDSKQRNSHPFHQQSGTYTQEVAILDLEKLQVLVQKKLPAGVKTGLIAGEFVFLIPGSGDILYRFDRKSLGNSKRQFLKAKASKLVRHDQKHLGIFLHKSHDSVMNLVNIQSLEMLAPNKRFQNMHFSSHGSSLQRIGPDLVDGQNAITRFSDGKMVAAKSAQGIPLLHGNVRGGNSMSQYDRSSKLFGRYSRGAAIQGASSNTIAQFPSYVYCSSFIPVAFSVRSETERKGRSQTSKLFLDSFSTLDGEAIDSKLIDSGQAVGRGRHMGEHRNLEVLEDKVILVEKQKVYSLPITKKQKSAPMPLHIPWKTVKPLNVESKQVLDIKAVGGAGAIEYSLLSEYEGIEIDSNSGRVTVDTPKLWKAYLGGQGQKRDRFFHDASATIKPSDWYERITGESLPKDVMPFAVKIHVAATDPEQQEDRQSFYAFVLAPRGEYDALKAKQQSEMAKEMAERRAKADERRREQKRVREEQLAAQMQLQKDRGSPESADRLGDLEKRVRRMEATLDSILEKLEKMQKNPDGGK